jgi:polyisoprenoid-binding protein YceI
MKSGLVFAGIIVAICLAAATEAIRAPGAEAAGQAEAPLPPPNMDAAALPAGTYKLDARHAHITGTNRRQSISDFQFRFDTFDATFTYDPRNPEASKVEVTLDPASFSSGFEAIDRNVDREFLEAMKFPQIKFVSTSIRRTSPTKGTMAGNVSLVGFTKPMTFDVTFHGFNSARRYSVGFGATATVKLSDFGPMAVMFRDGHNLADDVHLTVDAVFDRVAE